MTYYTSLDMLKLLNREQMQRWLSLNQAISNLDFAVVMGLANVVTETSDPNDGSVLGFDVAFSEDEETAKLIFETTWSDKDSVDADKRSFFESQHYTDGEIQEILDQ